MIKTGDHVEAKIIGIDDTRISLSMKALKADPWEQVLSRYQVGQVVSGKVDKINHFGAFVYLDKDIHGLAHVSEFQEVYPGRKIEEVFKEGEDYSWKILSIEPKSHRRDCSRCVKARTKKPKQENILAPQGCFFIIPTSMQNLFIVSGPSGSGQDSVIEGLRKRLPIERVITTTTREKRPGESEGHPYHFLSQETFAEKVALGEFVEHARTYNNQDYGVTQSELERVSQSGRAGIWKMEYQGVVKAKKLFPEIPAVLITADIETLRQRIQKRDKPDAAFLESRMQYTQEHFSDISIYDYVIQNRDGALDESIDALQAIIEKHFLTKKG